jgi:butyryl-CoA dehydrogenase
VVATLLSARDVEFLLYDWLQAAELPQRARFSTHSRETFDALLAMCADLAASEFAPLNRLLDDQEPRFDGERVHQPEPVRRALQAFTDAGLLGLALPPKLGGEPVPAVVRTACLAWFQAANIALAAYPFLTIANMNLLLAHASEDQVQTWVAPMAAGRFFGTMCLSEPGAGSSLADITTKAVPDAATGHRVFGNKMWISGGEHDLAENIVHLVLARIVGAPAGVKGLSLFIVPKFLLDEQGNVADRNDVTLAGLNHKMGYRGTVNALLNFGEGKHLPHGSPGAVAHLVGQPNRGLEYMFHMMNEARIGVGAGAAALGYTAYLKALAYARERIQGRPFGNRTAAPTAIIQHPDVRRMLLAQKAYAEGGLALVLYCARLVDEANSALSPADREQADLLLDVLTPIAKAWPSQWCLAGTDLAIQVHGGYGYTRDHDVEQHYRDNRLNLIHEGTNGIQALDLLGRKVLGDRGIGLRALFETVQTCIAAANAGGGEGAELADQLAHTWRHLMEVTDQLIAPGETAATLALASFYLEAVGHAVVAWIWLAQFLATDRRPGDFYEGKRAACRYFHRYELPRVTWRLELVASGDRTLLEVVDAQF